MTRPTEFAPCDYCHRSLWVHPLRGAWLYCDEVGGRKAPASIDTVNLIRGIMGKRDAMRR